MSFLLLISIKISAELSANMFGTNTLSYKHSCKNRLMPEEGACRNGFTKALHLLEIEQNQSTDISVVQLCYNVTRYTVSTSLR